MTTSTDSTHWPRIAVISDQSVSRSASGELLFYRLLESVPPERIRVIEGDNWPSKPELRLPGVEYRTVRPVSKHIVYSGRLGGVLGLPTVLTWGRRGVRQAVRALDGFQPEVILTVTHGYLCLTAAAVARHYNVPYHTVSYDEWHDTVSKIPLYRRLLESQFCKLYRNATARFCVSPFMLDNYEARTGARGVVLYPSRGDDSPIPKLRVRERNAAFTVAYFGSLYADYPETVLKLVDVLAAIGGKLLLFTQHGDRISDRPNLQKMGFLSPQKIAEALENRVDALFLPMSFQPEHSRSMSTAFPSKLADYTAMGLPILICGPSYCSAIRWANENPGVALTATEPSAIALRNLFGPILSDPKRSRSLAETALDVGNEIFDLQRIRSTFQHHISRIP